MTDETEIREVLGVKDPASRNEVRLYEQSETIAFVAVDESGYERVVKLSTSNARRLASRLLRLCRRIEARA